jgi:CheY-like chemotaxis protein
MRIFKHVFLIDDDPMFNFLTKTALKKVAFADDIHDYVDASEALDTLRNQIHSDKEVLPEIIFLDLNMPGMDGWDFLEEYRKLPESFIENCKVYILTSSIDTNDINRSRLYPFVSDFISKPLTLSTLTSIRQSN